MTAVLLRRLRLARLALSLRFMVFVMLVVLANTGLGMILAFNHVRGPVLAAQQLVVIVPILAFYGLVGPTTGMLRDIREYERVTSRVVLPADF